MAQGIIKSVTPQMFNGVQQTWQNKYTGKPNYGFYIVFEDGTSGSCGSEKNVYPLQPGTEVTYELSANSNGGSNHITKVKKLEPFAGTPLNGNGDGNGKTYNDPGTVKRIAFSMCQTIARQHFTNAYISSRTIEDVNTLAGSYHW